MTKPSKYIKALDKFTVTTVYGSRQLAANDPIILGFVRKAFKREYQLEVKTEIDQEKLHV